MSRQKVSRLIRNIQRIPLETGKSLMIYQARARSARARRACALRALGLLLADGTPRGGRGEDFFSRQLDFFTETAVTLERKVEKSFPRWEINRHDKG